MKSNFQMAYDRAAYIKQPLSIKFELKLLFPASKPLIIFDIGACEGEESVRYSLLFPHSRIYTFEPLPLNIELIKANFIKYDIRNASLHQKAISSKNGVDHFYVSSGKPRNLKASDWDFGNKSSSLLEPSKYLQENSFLTFKDKIEVETITLKTFCHKHKVTGIDFIHMDVQGAELMVLEGAKDLISSVKAIWLEVSKIDFYNNQPLVEDIKDFMKKNQFILLKDELNSEQGDQLYISKLHFTSSKIFFIKKLISLRSVATRLRSILK
jgi:FkbM family methyltransferase